MKFGKHLNTRLIPEWRFYYMEYDDLKNLLKEKTKAKQEFNQYDEAYFVEVLDREVQKVMDFKELKSGELNRRIHHYEDAFSSLDLSKLDEKSLKHISSEIEKITTELSQLGKYCRINYTGFLKILKKHDKHTPFKLSSTFMVRFNMHPIYLENMDNMIYRLSKLYNILTHKGKSLNEFNNGSNGNAGSQSFIRKTSKYWVHPDNVTDVKIMILKNLPVLIYQGKKGNFDQAISSVYLDNESLELYTGRLEKAEGAQAIRLRWYGSESPNEVFIERKIHREDWTGEISVKNRFPLKEKYIDAYLSGTYTIDKTIKKLRDSGRKTEAELTELKNLADGIQSTITNMSLKPMMRTFYNRTAFQLPGDASVRISLDTELAMIKEDEHIEDHHWRRSDIESDYPFPKLPNSEIVRFPYAILEVKLQTQVGEEAPKWVLDMVNGPLVEEVPKFSKFVHGCAILFEKNVSLFPFWLSQMSVDIRKPLASNQNNGTDDEKKTLYDPRDINSRNTAATNSNASQASTSRTNMLPSSNEMDSSPSRRSSEVKIDITKPIDFSRPLPDYSFNDKNIIRDPHPKNGDEKTPLLETDTEKRKPLSKWGSLTSLLRGRSKMKYPQSVTASNHSRGTVPGIANGKRIALPVRIEPKVFFANERTFLQWLHFAIFLGGISTALVGLGNSAAQVSGHIFALVSVLFAFYALYLYQWRATKIRQRDPGPYDDRIGPVVLVFVFLAAMALNFLFKGYIFESSP